MFEFRFHVTINRRFLPVLDHNFFLLVAFLSFFLSSTHVVLVCAPLVLKFIQLPYIDSGQGGLNNLALGGED